ncbi:DUF938 domain-containing protein [Alteromonas confluentis]|uniref:Methylase n=1 Tax=Alteromonas confluentis TaxID=1656094 RepID=A0A1E7Z5U7_9ALTE|nr:DUF938 domain-containing protein [Alteromonas confluentis]OFC68906.1 hypothetical protein BFC18_19355 [Alteromonas confluentis]
MTGQLPFSQACENNKGPILAILKDAFADRKRVLEVGSGTGQHAVHFAPNLPHLIWQTSDQPVYHEGIKLWLSAYPSENLLSPLSLTVGQGELPFAEYDAVYSANTAHIMQKAEIAEMMQTLSEALPQGGVFCQYGPFTDDGVFSSHSNREFHLSLLERGCGGYRDIQELEAWAPALTLVEVHTMPANNLLLQWKKR